MFKIVCFIPFIFIRICIHMNETFKSKIFGAIWTDSVININISLEYIFTTCFSICLPDGSQNHKLINTCRTIKVSVIDWFFLRNIIISMCCKHQTTITVWQTSTHIFRFPSMPLYFLLFFSRNQSVTKIFRFNYCRNQDNCPFV